MSVSNFMDQYVICWEGRYVLKRGGMNIQVDDPCEATGFDDMDDAKNARPGHDRAMGGSGQKGYSIRRDLAKHKYDNQQYRSGAYR